MGKNDNLSLFETIGVFALGVFSELVWKPYREYNNNKNKQNDYEDLGYAVIVEDEKKSEIIN